MIRTWKKFGSVENITRQKAIDDVVNYGFSGGLWVANEKVHGCFTSDTLITLSNGEQIPISEVEDGMFVLSFDKKRNDFVSSKILKVINSGKDKNKIWVKLYFLDNIIICTSEHLFLTKNRCWVKAIDLNEKDDIIDIF